RLQSSIRIATARGPAPASFHFFGSPGGTHARRARKARHRRPRPRCWRQRRPDEEAGRWESKRTPRRVIWKTWAAPAQSAGEEKLLAGASGGRVRVLSEGP